MKNQMPNRNYLNGVRKERAIVNHHRAAGRLAFRSAGSHSQIDVVAIDTVNHLIYLIQCKPPSMNATAKSKLLQSLQYLDGIYIMKVSVE